MNKLSFIKKLLDGHKCLVHIESDVVQIDITCSDLKYAPSKRKDIKEIIEALDLICQFQFYQTVLKEND